MWWWECVPSRWACTLNGRVGELYIQFLRSSNKIRSIYVCERLFFNSCKELYLFDKLADGVQHQLLTVWRYSIQRQDRLCWTMPSCTSSWLLADWGMSSCRYRLVLALVMYGFPTDDVVDNAVWGSYTNKMLIPVVQYNICSFDCQRGPVQSIRPTYEVISVLEREKSPAELI